MQSKPSPGATYDEIFRSAINAALRSKKAICARSPARHGSHMLDEDATLEDMLQYKGSSKTSLFGFDTHPSQLPMALVLNPKLSPSPSTRQLTASAAAVFTSMSSSTPHSSQQQQAAAAAQGNPGAHPPLPGHPPVLHPQPSMRGGTGGAAAGTAAAPTGPLLQQVGPSPSLVRRSQQQQQPQPLPAQAPQPPGGVPGPPPPGPQSESGRQAAWGVVQAVGAFKAQPSLRRPGGSAKEATPQQQQQQEGVVRVKERKRADVALLGLWDMDVREAAAEVRERLEARSSRQQLRAAQLPPTSRLHINFFGVSSGPALALAQRYSAELAKQQGQGQGEQQGLGAAGVPGFYPSPFAAPAEALEEEEGEGEGEEGGGGQQQGPGVLPRVGLAAGQEGVRGWGRDESRAWRPGVMSSRQHSPPERVGRGRWARGEGLRGASRPRAAGSGGPPLPKVPALNGLRSSWAPGGLRGAGQGGQGDPHSSRRSWGGGPAALPHSQSLELGQGQREGQLAGAGGAAAGAGSDGSRGKGRAGGGDARGGWHRDLSALPSRSRSPSPTLLPLPEGQPAARGSSPTHGQALTTPNTATAHTALPTSHPGPVAAAAAAAAAGAPHLKGTAQQQLGRSSCPDLARSSSRHSPMQPGPAGGRSTAPAGPSPLTPSHSQASRQAVSLSTPQGTAGSCPVQSELGSQKTAEEAELEAAEALLLAMQEVNGGGKAGPGPHGAHGCGPPGGGRMLTRDGAAISVGDAATVKQGPPPRFPAPLLMGVPLSQLSQLEELPSVTTVLSSRMWHPPADKLAPPWRKQLVQQMESAVQHRAAQAAEERALAQAALPPPPPPQSPTEQRRALLLARLNATQPSSQGPGSAAPPPLPIPQQQGGEGAGPGSGIGGRGGGSLSGGTLLSLAQQERQQAQGQQGRPADCPALQPGAAGQHGQQQQPQQPVLQPQQPLQQRLAGEQGRSKAPGAGQPKLAGVFLAAAEAAVWEARAQKPRPATQQRKRTPTNERAARPRSVSMRGNPLMRGWQSAAGGVDHQLLMRMPDIVRKPHTPLLPARPAGAVPLLHTANDNPEAYQPSP